MPSSLPAPDGAGRLSVAEALGWCGRRPHREALRTDTIGGPLIRPATPEDAAAVVDLVVQAEMFSADEAGLVEGMLADYFGGNADGGHACVIDEEDGTLGVAYYQPKPAADRVWDLTMIAVRPDRQGRGRGSAMLRGVEEDLRARGQRLLLVETSALPQYERTREFYARCGYEQEARVRDYWAEGDDLVVFRKALDAH